MDSVKQSKSKSKSVSYSFSDKMSSGGEVSGEDSFLTAFQVINVCDIPEIYTHICYTVYKDELKSNPETLLSNLKRLSFINLKSENIAVEFCNVLQSKNLKDLNEFIERKINVARKSSIFRFDPAVILDIFIDHDTYEQATYFMRYILHSAHLPADMNIFFETYKNADSVSRDAMIPKVIYSWIDIE